MSVEKEIKDGMRKFLADKGQKVEFEESRWDDEPPRASQYGWTDYEATDHINGYSTKVKCSWIVPEGTEIQEETYSMFMGTFTSNEDEVGINAPGCHCACGKYKDVTLRITCSLGEAIRGVLGYDPTKKLVL